MSTIDEEVATALRDLALGDVTSGATPACAYAVAYDGDIVVSESFGAAVAGSQFVAMSVSKSLFDSAIWVLLGTGQLALDDTVATHIPEFGTHGKDRVTVEQLMTHTGGFPYAALDFPKWASRDERLQAFAEWHLDTEPGTQYVYHPSSHSWVEAELIRRITGVDHRDFFKNAVLKPLGLADRIWLGEPADQQNDVLFPVLTMPDAVQKLLPPPFRSPQADGGFCPPAGLATSAGLAAGFPGAGVVATVDGIALLYQAYLHNPAGIWDPTVLADATSTVRANLPDDEHGDAGSHDRTPHDPVNILRTISMVLAGPRVSRYGSRAFFGSHVSDAAFGHLGLGGNTAWADPATGLSFCYLTSGVAFLPGLPQDGILDRSEQLSTLAASLLSEA